LCHHLLLLPVGPTLWMSIRSRFSGWVSHSERIGGTLTLLSVGWLPLLQRLTRMSESWGVWKNADRALAGHGDVDSTAPSSEHFMLAEEFHRWATEMGLKWVIRCPHGGRMLGLFGVDQSRWAQLDLVSEWPFRGARLFSAEDLVPLMVMDPRGFRRLREGAEGLLLFINKGFRWRGTPASQGLVKYGILEKITQDWPGTEAAAALLGAAGDSLLAAVCSALQGEWNAPALLRVEARMILRGLAEPRMFVSRVITRGWTIPRCSVNRAVVAGRRPQRLEEWLRSVEKNHTVQIIPKPLKGP
jgi:hypothetical protein